MSDSVSGGRLAAWMAALAVGGAMLAAPSASRADWVRGESDHFVVYGQSEKVVREYVGQLEDFDALLRGMHRLSADEGAAIKLPVYVVRDNAQLREIAPRIGEHVQGAYFPHMTGVFAVAVREGVGLGLDHNRSDDTVLHEYVHHFMMQYFPGVYPAWLVEGYAEYYMTADLGPKRILIGDFNSGRINSLSDPRGWLPMDVVLGKQPRELHEGEIGRYYAQSWLLTHYALSDPGRKKQLDAYLNALAGGTPSLEAWAKTFGDDPRTLERKLRAYVKGSLAGREWSRDGLPAPKLTLTRMPDGADDLLLLERRLTLGYTREERAPLLATIEAAAAKRPTERYSRRVQATARTLLGDRAAGEAELRALVAEDPTDEAALIALGRSRLVTARETAALRAEASADAAQILAKAFKINPDNPFTLNAYAESRSMTAKPTEAVVNVRLKAAVLAPQVHYYRLAAARALIQTGDPAGAREILEPLAADPHGGHDADVASQMLTSLAKGGDGGKAETIAPASAPDSGV